MGYREDDADNVHQDIEEIGGGGQCNWVETPPQPWVVAGQGAQRAGPKVDGARGRKSGSHAFAVLRDYPFCYDKRRNQTWSLQQDYDFPTSQEAGEIRDRPPLSLRGQDATALLPAARPPPPPPAAPPSPLRRPRPWPSPPPTGLRRSSHPPVRPPSTHRSSTSPSTSLRTKASSPPTPPPASSSCSAYLSRSTPSSSPSPPLPLPSASHPPPSTSSSSASPAPPPCASVTSALATLLMSAPASWAVGSRLPR
jgi:hypothetical protein